MGKGLLISVLLLCGTASCSQIKFQKITFDQALQQAKAQNKLIFLQIESSECTQCNEVADKALGSEKLFEALKDKFVFLKINDKQPEYERVKQDYNEPHIGTLFLNSGGTLIHRYTHTTTLVDKYIEESEIALNKSASAENIAILDKQYQEGNRNLSFLENYLNQRRELGLPTDSILDQYVSILPTDSLQSLSTLQFIASQAPVLNTVANKTIRKNMDLFNQAWYRLPLQQRVDINNRIIAKTKKLAIDKKDINLAYRAAGFAQGTYTNNPENGQRVYAFTIMDYFQGIKDTARYLTSAESYYDRFYMTIPVQKITMADSIKKQELLDKVSGDTTLEYHTVKVSKKIEFSPATQYYANALNTGAWSFYKMTNDTSKLNKALQWSKRSLEFYESPQAMDTYAHLLYKTGNKKEAIVWEQKAIDLSAERGFPTKEYESVLKTIKRNDRLVD